MPTLPECQAFFGRLMQGDAAAADDWFEPGCDHWEVYHRSLQGVYAVTLTDIYPVLRAVLGEGAFGRLSQDYGRTCPSLSGDLHDYGGGLAAFVAGLEPLAVLPYLADLARLEWAAHRLFHAADAQAISLDDLAAGDIQPAIHPACMLLHCRWPVQRIWQAHQGGAVPAHEIDLGEGPVVLLLSRPAFVVCVTPLPAPSARLAASLLEGEGLEQACKNLLATDAGVDLGAALFPLLDAGALTAGGACAGA